MKKLLIVTLCLLGAMSASARDRYSHDQNVLPVAAQTVLKNNFKSGVNHIKIDKDWGRVSEYEVILNDGTEITFDTKGNWKDIEVGRDVSIPKGLVPASILDYVKQNQKSATITGIEKSRSGYEVELSNGVEMKFNSAGTFLRYDD